LLRPPPTPTLSPYTTLFRSHQPHLKARAGGNALERPRIRLRGDAVDGIFALYLGELVIQVLAHLHSDALHHQRRVVNSQSGRTGDRKSTRLNSSHRTISYAV